MTKTPFTERLDKALNKAELAFLIVFLASIVILSFLHVVLRYFCGGAPPLGDIVARHLILPASFMGLQSPSVRGRR